MKKTFAPVRKLIFQQYDSFSGFESQPRCIEWKNTSATIPNLTCRNAVNNDRYGNGSSRFLTRYFQQPGKFFPPVGFGQHRHVYRHTVLPRKRLIRVARRKHYPQARAQPTCLNRELHSIHAAGHHDVGEQDIHPRRAPQKVKRFRGIPRRKDLVAEIGQVLDHGC